MEFHLKFQEGETIAFVGPSGAGKDNSRKTVSGALYSAKGRILFNNIPADQIDFDEMTGKNWICYTGYSIVFRNNQRKFVIRQSRCNRR